MYVTVTSKCEIITTHHCRDVEVIRVQDMYVDHWKVKDAPGVMKYTRYSLQLDFFCGVLFYMKFCSFCFFLSFSTAEIVLFIILVSYFKMSPEKKIELQKRNWPICNDGIKAQKICTTRKFFLTNEIKFLMAFSEKKNAIFSCKSLF